MLRRIMKPVVLMAVLALAIGISIPAISIAGSQQGSMFDETRAKAPAQSATPHSDSGDCTLTVNYYEGVWYDDPDVEVDEDSRVFLGEHVVTGLSEGDVIDAWDYVVDIPGHIFFDGWPATLTISADPAQNELTLIYAKLWESEYTVNYYMMIGADLTADNWTDALAPEGVEFIKLGSETFENQRFDSIVKGDAYEYKLDGMYVIDTYPAQIRLDVNPDNNVLNVLYTPDSVNLPDDMEIRDLTTLPDDYEVPDAPEEGDESNGTVPDEPASGDSPDDDASDGSGGDDSSDSTLPEDTTMSKDHLIALLPDSVLVAMESGSTSGSGNDVTGGNGSAAPGGNESSGGDTSAAEIIEDFIGNDVGEGELVVTEGMLSDPQNKDEAALLKQAYQTGVHQTSEAAKMGDMLRVTPYICIALVAIIIFMVCAFLLKRRKDS